MLLAGVRKLKMRRPPLSRFVPSQKRGADPLPMAHWATSSATGAIKLSCTTVRRTVCAKEARHRRKQQGERPSIMAIFGWDMIKEAEKYTAKADQRRLAESAMHLADRRALAKINARAIYTRLRQMFCQTSAFRTLKLKDEREP